MCHVPIYYPTQMEVYTHTHATHTQIGSECSVLLKIDGFVQKSNYLEFAVHCVYIKIFIVAMASVSMCFVNLSMVTT